MPSLLLITNEEQEGTEYGFRDEFERLHTRGALTRYEAVAPLAHWRSGADWETDVVETVIEAARRAMPDVLLILSPKASPWTEGQVRAVIGSAGHPCVAYWEGDAWGGRKRPTSSMHWWLRASDAVFSVALGAQRDLLHRAGAARVRSIPHTYCHVQFAAAEASWSPMSDDAASRVVMIGSLAGRVPGYSSVPGTAGRRRLGRLAEQRLGNDFRVYGRGWRGASAGGMVPFAEQLGVIREAGVSINWDHFPRLPAYASDRLANSLIAGRVHVTTHHPELEWLPGPAQGLFLKRSPRKVIDATQALRARPIDQLAELGRLAYEWTRDRLSDRQAARYLVAQTAGDGRSISQSPGT